MKGNIKRAKITLTQEVVLVSKNCVIDRASSWSTLYPPLTVPHHDLTLGKKKRWVAFPGAHLPRMPQERNQTTEREMRQSKVWG